MASKSSTNLQDFVGSKLQEEKLSRIFWYFENILVFGGYFGIWDLRRFCRLETLHQLEKGFPSLRINSVSYNCFICLVWSLEHLSLPYLCILLTSVSAFCLSTLSCFCLSEPFPACTSFLLSDYSLIAIEDRSSPQLVVHCLRDVLVHLHVQLVQVFGAQLKQLLVLTSDQNVQIKDESLSRSMGGQVLNANVKTTPHRDVG